MTRTEGQSETRVTPARTAASGYRKGTETRARILGTALQAFGATGFEATTTRQIAVQAETNLPALTYYFGNKQGLYLACAHEIVARYRAGVGTVAAVAHAALVDPLDASEARLLLKRLFAALARFLLMPGGAESQTAFVQREIASPGPAFDILYAELWLPGIELAAALIARGAEVTLAKGEARVRAVMMLSSLTGFLSGRRVIERALGNQDEIALVLAVVDSQIDALSG